MLAFVLLIGLSIPLSVLERPDDLLTVEVPSSLVIDQVNVVDVRTGRIVRDQRITIVDGVIEDIGSTTVPLEEGANVVDGAGAFVLPGLFDMHLHLHDRKYLGMYLAYGVTSVRNMRGLPMHLRWREELKQGEWLGSNLYTSSPVLDGAKYAHALQQVVTDPSEARRLVRMYRNKGYDLIKAYGFLEKDVFEAIVEEAELVGIPVAKHGPNAIEGLPLSSNRGMQSLEHVEDILQGALEFDFNLVALSNWVEEFKSLNPVVTPTLATFDHLTQLSQSKEAFIEALPMATLNPLYRTINREFEVKRWLSSDVGQAEWNAKVRDYLLEIVKALDDEGIKLLVGSDAGTLYLPPGSSTHREMALMVQAGLETETVLRSATINAAETIAFLLIAGGRRRKQAPFVIVRVRRSVRSQSCFLALAVLAALTLAESWAVPPYSGSIFLDPDIITEEDPSTLVSIEASGLGNRLVFDRRVNAWVTLNLRLFQIRYEDGIVVEGRVNLEFDAAVAATLVEKYGRVIGQLPAVLKTDVESFTLHDGLEPFGGGNRNLLIHHGQGEQYESQGILEEVFVHEATHTSLDAAHAQDSGWILAQEKDGEFITTYARDFPVREDLAETFLLYLAVDYRKDRLSQSLIDTVIQTIPARLEYLRGQAFDLYPLTERRLLPVHSIRPQAESNRLELAWDSEETGQYAIDESRNLVQWKAVSGRILASGSQTTASIELSWDAAPDARFYRIRKWIEPQ